MARWLGDLVALSEALGLVPEPTWWLNHQLFQFQGIRHPLLAFMDTSHACCAHPYMRTNIPTVKMKASESVFKNLHVNRTKQRIVQVAQSQSLDQNLASLFIMLPLLVPRALI